MKMNNPSNVVKYSEVEIEEDRTVFTIDDDDEDSFDNVDLYDDYMELQTVPAAIVSPICVDDQNNKELDKKSNNKKEYNNDDDFKHQPHELQMYRWENVAVPLNYLLVGLVMGLIFPLINVYPLDLGATEAQQTTISTFRALPSCFKIIFGFWSDNLPVQGQKRKPYMILGWIVSVMSLFPLLLWSDLSVLRVVQDQEVQQEDVNYNFNTTLYGNNNNTLHGHTTVARLAPEQAPSIALLCVCFFFWSCGMWIADTMGDSLVAEKAKLETPENRGNLQTICYILRGIGTFTTMPLSSFLYGSSTQGPFLVIGLTALLPVFFLPFWYLLYERKFSILEMSTRDQCQELWKTVCSRAVWQPMGFHYFYVTLFVTNSAWKQFLESVLDFTPNQLNALMIIAGSLAFAGLATYKLVLSTWSWQTVYFVGFVLNGIFSALQLLLIKGETFGLDPFMFSLGDDAMRDFIIGTQYLPMVVMMVNLVPSGIEGASCALFTTTWNVASTMSDSLSTMLLGIWDVSKETLISGDLSGLANLTILTTILQIIPIFFVWLLPHNVEHLTQMKENDSYSSKIGGAIFLLVVGSSVAWSIFVSFMNIFYPGWMGES